MHFFGGNAADNGLDGGTSPPIDMSGHFSALMSAKSCLPICLLLGPHAKFKNPRTTTSGRKVTKAERKREEKKNAINSGHYVLPATPKGRACTSLRPTIF